jgi:hypothetical protein
MSVFDRTLRIAVALAVAVPLGPGGICCCLFEKAEAAPVESVPAEVARAEAAPVSCCHAEAPAPGPEGSPPEEPECKCPERPVAELAPSLPGDAFVAPLSEHAAAWAEVVLPGPGLLLAEFRAEAPPPDPPPPAARRHAALSVYRC